MSGVVRLWNTLYILSVLFVEGIIQKEQRESLIDLNQVSSSALPLFVSFLIQAPVLQINSGPPLVGLGTIACHLVKEAKRPDLLGDSAESRAVVQQWIEHRVTKLDRCRKDDVKTFLKVMFRRYS